MTAEAESVEIVEVPWWLVLLQGIAALVLGVLFITKPGMTTLVVVQIVGIYWFMGGIFGIVSIFIDKSMWGWKLLSGILGILAGIMIIQHPLWTTVLVPTVLVIIFGVQGLIIGVVQLFQAFKGGGLGVGVLGALSIIFGLVLLGSPVLGATVLPWVFGIFGIAGGIAAIFAAFRLKE